MSAFSRTRAWAGGCKRCWVNWPEPPGQRIALVCQDWANTKAAYRFLSNEHVSEADILAGHFAATRERIAAAGPAPVRVLHDTTEFS